MGILRNQPEKMQQTNPKKVVCPQRKVTPTFFLHDFCTVARPWDIFWPKSTPKLTENHQNPWIFMKIGELQAPLIFFVGKTGTSAYKILISTPRDLSIALVKRFTRLAAEYIKIYNS